MESKGIPVVLYMLLLLPKASLEVPFVIPKALEGSFLQYLLFCKDALQQIFKLALRVQSQSCRYRQPVGKPARSQWTVRFFTAPAMSVFHPERFKTIAREHAPYERVTLSSGIPPGKNELIVLLCRI